MLWACSCEADHEMVPRAAWCRACQAVTAPVVVFGAHGGAGCSTLAGALAVSLRRDLFAADPGDLERSYFDPGSGRQLDECGLDGLWSRWRSGELVAPVIDAGRINRATDEARRFGLDVWGLVPSVVLVVARSTYRGLRSALVADWPSGASCVLARRAEDCLGDRDARAIVPGSVDLVEWVWSAADGRRIDAGLPLATGDGSALGGVSAVVERELALGVLSS